MGKYSILTHKFSGLRWMGGGRDWIHLHQNSTQNVATDEEGKTAAELETVVWKMAFVPADKFAI